ncbi:hypothetical protein CHARACLAT_004839 [Characodon lateralis]|uniref:Uncharacterized protein n=1 Tax=Characodon lateralis TaxID=208331 RepID=A0ABU7DNC9_9TELE|nr:hypothetical protein [Characodon lateralis]
MLSPRPPPTPVRAREEAGRQKRAEESGSNSNSNELTARHTHSAQRSLFNPGTRRAAERRRSGGKSQRQGEKGRGSLAVWRRTTMASDPGLSVMLLWTISLQAVVAAGTNSNEGHPTQMWYLHQTKTIP